MVVDNEKAFIYEYGLIAIICGRNLLWFPEFYVFVENPRFIRTILNFVYEFKIGRASCRERV